MAFGHMMLPCLATAVAFLLLPRCADAYIPAMPTNDTTGLSSGGSFSLGWTQPPAGHITHSVNLQLAMPNSTFFARGAFLHFTEANTTGPPSISDPTNAPWVAFINCDDNGTASSMDNDIFTLARDRGASAALLYSKYSAACLMDEDYVSGTNDDGTPEFEKVLDVYSFTDSKTALYVNQQFDRINTLDRTYNSSRLNASATFLDEAAARMGPSGITGMSNTTSEGYLITALVGMNSTFTLQNNGTTTGSASPSGSPSGGIQTGLAMIVLYAITGFVTLMFLVVILTGAVRAIRHPERYGPRAATGGGGFGPDGEMVSGQTRVGGIARAVLDTFPIVKYHRNAPPGRVEEGGVGVVARDGDATKSAGDAGGVGGRHVETGEGDGAKDIVDISKEDIELQALAMTYIADQDHDKNSMASPAAVAGVANVNTSTMPTTSANMNPASASTLVAAATSLNWSGSRDGDGDGEGGSFVSATVTADEAAGAAATGVVDEEGLGEKHKERRTPFSSPGVEQQVYDAERTKLSTDPRSPPTREEAKLAVVAAVSAPAEPSSSSSSSSQQPHPHSSPYEDPSEIDSTETCPICVCEFTDGDDVRVLPCAGKHAFHVACVDEWLVNVSAVCPLCRQDFSEFGNSSYAVGRTFAEAGGGSAEGLAETGGDEGQLGHSADGEGARLGHGGHGHGTFSQHRARFSRYIAAIRAQTHGLHHKRSRQTVAASASEGAGDAEVPAGAGAGAGADAGAGQNPTEEGRLPVQTNAGSGADLSDDDRAQ